MELDWSKRDIVLSEETGVSRQRIGILRKTLGMPAPRGNTTIPRESEHRRSTILRMKAYLNGKTIGQIEDAVGFRIGTKPLRKFVQSVVCLEREHKIPYRQCNWALHDQDIARSWGISQAKIGYWRKHHKVHLRMYNPLPPHHPLIRAEREKARKFHGTR